MIDISFIVGSCKAECFIKKLVGHTTPSWGSSSDISNVKFVSGTWKMLKSIRCPVHSYKNWFLFDSLSRYKRDAMLEQYLTYLILFLHGDLILWNRRTFDSFSNRVFSWLTINRTTNKIKPSRGVALSGWLKKKALICAKSCSNKTSIDLYQFGSRFHILYQTCLMKHCDQNKHRERKRESVFTYSI